MENTTDEMNVCYIHYLPYEQGDELLDLESMMELPNSVNIKYTYNLYLCNA